LIFHFESVVLTADTYRYGNLELKFHCCVLEAQLISASSQCSIAHCKSSRVRLRPDWNQQLSILVKIIAFGNLMLRTSPILLLILCSNILLGISCCGRLNTELDFINRDQPPLAIVKSISDQSVEESKMLYNNLLRKLYNINLLNPVKMGLDNARSLYKLFDEPVNNIPIIHVAGTNGKGSVALKVATCLKIGGVKTGLFVSPHISSFRERIQVNGESMSEETVVVSFSCSLRLKLNWLRAMRSVKMNSIVFCLRISTSILCIQFFLVAQSPELGTLNVTPSY
jgi:hypothetical protein